MALPPCPVCHQPNTSTWSEARDYEYFTTPDTYTYFHCRACQSIFIHPVPVDQLAMIYPSNYYSFVDGKKNIVTRIKEKLDERFFKNILGEMKQTSIRVLDVGGGTGWLSSLIRKTDARVVHTQIVDIDQKASTIAEAAGHSYFQGRLEDFSTEEKFDLILMLNLIEHVSDPLAVLRMAESFLSAGGRIVIKTPNTDSLDARWFRNTYWGGLHAPRHWVIFSEKSFRKLLSGTSLHLHSLQYTQGGPFWAFSCIVALHKRNRIRVDQNRPVIFHPLFPVLSAIGAAFDFLRRPFSRTSQMFILLKHLDKKNR